MNTWKNQCLACLSIISSIALVLFAIVYSPNNKIVLYALSPIGILTGRGILIALNNKQPEAKAWLYEHLGAMLGCGIAFHTAFAVFGASRLFGSLPGHWAIFPWVAPTIIGTIATLVWTRRYKRKFST